MDEATASRVPVTAWAFRPILASGGAKNRRLVTHRDPTPTHDV